MGFIGPPPLPYELKAIVSPFGRKRRKEIYDFPTFDRQFNAIDYVDEFVRKRETQCNS